MSKLLVLFKEIKNNPKKVIRGQGESPIKIDGAFSPEMAQQFFRELYRELSDRQIKITSKQEPSGKYFSLKDFLSANYVYIPIGSDPRTGGSPNSTSYGSKMIVNDEVLLQAILSAAITILEEHPDDADYENAILSEITKIYNFNNYFGEEIMQKRASQEQIELYAATENFEDNEGDASMSGKSSMHAAAASAAVGNKGSDTLNPVNEDDEESDVDETNGQAARPPVFPNTNSNTPPHSGSLIRASQIYPIPKDGDCLYAAFIVALMHAWFTGAMNENTNIHFGSMTRQFLNGVATKRNYKFSVGSIVEKFKALIRDAQNNEYKLLNEDMVPVLRGMIANYALGSGLRADVQRRIKYAMDYVNKNDRSAIVAQKNVDSNASILPGFESRVSADSISQPYYKEYFSIVSDPKTRRKSSIVNESREGTLVSFFVLESLFQIQTTQTQILRNELRLNDIAGIKLDIRQMQMSSNHYEVYVTNKDNDLERFCFQANSQCERNKENHPQLNRRLFQEKWPAHSVRQSNPIQIASASTYRNDDNEYLENASSTSAQTASAVNVEIAPNQEFNAFQDAMSEYYKVGGNKQSALQLLIKIALKLSDASLGLNVRAPSATAALTKQLSDQPTSIDEVYPHFYTILLATLVTENDNRVKNKAEDIQRAKHAITVVKEILTWLSNVPENFNRINSAIINVHESMVKRFCRSAETAIERLTQLDTSRCAEVDLMHIHSPSSHKAVDILRTLPFIWNQCYENVIDEQEPHILEKRRRFEILSVAALNDIITACTACEPLTLKQQWLLATAIVDYDNAVHDLRMNRTKRVLAVSPFYNAIKLLALERNKSVQALREELVKQFLINRKYIEALHPIQINLQEKLEQRQNQLLKASAITHSMSSISANFTSSNEAQINPPTSSERSIQGSFNTAVSSSSSSAAASSSVCVALQTLNNQYENQHDFEEKDIIDIFMKFDLECYQAEDKSALISLAQKAFKQMEALFLGEYKRSSRWSFYRDDQAPRHFDTFMKYIAPQEGIPPYLFALFCYYQANKNAPSTKRTTLHSYEDAFIIEHLHCLYNFEQRAHLDQAIRISGDQEALVKLGEYVAPFGNNATQENIRKSAIGLVYPRLNHALTKLEEKMARKTLTKTDMKLYEKLDCVQVSEKPENQNMCIGERVTSLKDYLKQHAAAPR